jgi:hypothetical protein
MSSALTEEEEDSPPIYFLIASAKNEDLENSHFINNIIRPVKMTTKVYIQKCSSKRFWLSCKIKTTFLHRSKTFY